MIVEALRRLITVLMLVSILCWMGCETATYEEHKQLMNTLLDPSVYDPQIRPLKDQSKTLTAWASFQLVSIVGIDDVGEKFVCNGFLALAWNDERLRWDPKDHGGESIFRPAIKALWKPRVLLLNTLTERDLFEDDNAPFSVEENGSVFWAPGSMFTVSCDLDMSNYPYDKQTCDLLLVSNGYPTHEVYLFGSNEPVGLSFFSPNGEWDLISSNVTTQIFPVDTLNLSGLKVSFTIQRRPMFHLLNLIIPVVLLSFLNIMVFLIPVDSGEKISYGITVLLAVAVFLSIVSSMLPRSSKVVPSVTIYLACLLCMSVLTVISCIIIVFLHNLEENENASIKATENFQRAFSKVRTLNNAVGPKPTALPRLAAIAHNTKAIPGFGGLGARQASSLSDSGSLSPQEDNVDEDEGDIKPRRDAWTNDANSSNKKKPRKNKYRLVGKYIDMVSFVVFLLIWLGLTIGFLTRISTDHSY